MGKNAIIIGAGPAGLTAAYEFLKRTDIKPTILEKSGDIGGISKTIKYKGNRMDIGGHRFFSKSDRVMNWWMNIMPLQQTEEEMVTINYRNKSHQFSAAQGASRPYESNSPGKVMLLRRRLSRIYFLRKFFTYPIQLSIDTLTKLGIGRTVQILLSYVYAQLVPRKPEKSLEDFLINRFGRQLYQLFFKDYTEKVWGVPCYEISAEWGAQRIKGVSISKAIAHATQMMTKKKKASNDIAQKDTETSLIEQFLYPALGPGQLWEEVARQVESLGGVILLNQHVKEIVAKDGRISSIIAGNPLTGEETIYEGDFFFSTMPIKELIAGMNGEVPEDVRAIANGLQYRDFITVGVLLEKLCTPDPKTGETKELNLEDTWIYIQEKDVKVGRLQLFNNWSPFMVSRPGDVWIGMEYFCNEGDSFWNLSDEEIKRTAVAELEKMGLAQVTDVIDSTVHRVEKTYPAYFGTYDKFDRIREYVDGYENLFLVGRNGMHKYNNADHSMLTAMTAVDNICAGNNRKDNIWAINTEQEYHEESKKVDTKVYPTEEVGPQKEQGLQPSFKEYLFKNRWNQRFLLISFVALILQLIIFKYLYPFASFINGDSYSYIDAAAINASLNIYPIGYSKFLRLVSVFTTSDTALITFQYLFLEVSMLTFLLTLFYFYQPSRMAKVVLFMFFVINPVFLYLANYVSSDAIFLSLSIFWFTLLLWIIQRPTPKLLLIHGLVLLLAFTIRYNALYYPLVAFVAFALSKQRIVWKLAGALLGILLIGTFIQHTSNEYKRVTGVKQFSPFSGWQLANNAMYAYKFVDSKKRVKVPTRFRELDYMVTAYFDSTKNNVNYPFEKAKASTYYMWSAGTPLQDYKTKRIKDSTADPLISWAAVGPLYADYGIYLIKKYPLHYFKYYIIPNTINYYSPPVEFLEQYNTGNDIVSSSARAWFGYKTKKIYTRVGSFNVKILGFLPILAGALNMLFFFGLLGYLLLGGYKKQPMLQKGIWLSAALWLTNFVFSVAASPTALRFQLFSMLVIIAFGTMFIEYMVKVTKEQRIELPTSEPATVPLT